MKAVHAKLIGRLGNQMFIWAHAKAFAEANGVELRTDPWVGEQVFTLDGYVPARPDGTEESILAGYFQTQADMRYTRRDCRRWFKLKPELERALEGSGFRESRVVAHLRRGDYQAAGYPIVGLKAYEKAIAESIGRAVSVATVSDDHPTRALWCRGDMDFLPDFYRLMTAEVLFRANSTFSWWAATLGDGRVFAPVIVGLQGGIEHDDVKFVEGNWPRCADLPGIVEDLHLPE